MDNLEDVFFSEEPVDAEKLKQNYKKLHDVFEGDFIMWAPEEYKEAEWDTLQVADSNLRAREWGVIAFYTKDAEYKFKTMTRASNLHWGVDFKSIGAIWPGRLHPPTMSIEETMISQGNIVCVPKYSRHPNWIVSSVQELLSFYDLYRAVPNTIKMHDKHGKKFTESSFFKLELIK